MAASPRIEDAVPKAAAKPSSSTSLPVRAPTSRTDAPSSLDSNDTTLKALEAATHAKDFSVVSNILQLLRKQYAQRKRRSWSPDTVRRVWSRVVEALRSSAVPEVDARACQLIEVLAQNCKSCIEGEWEVRLNTRAALYSRVIRAMEKYPSDLSVQSSCLRALLSMTGCMTCRSFYDKESQDLMGRAQAIGALVRALGILQQLTAKMQFETNAHKLARLAIADAVQTLHYICLLNPDNTAELAKHKGQQIIRTSIEDNLNELAVQEHGCMLLAALATSTVVTDEEILECVRTVTNVARLQMQEKFIEVARAAVWSLALVANNTIHPRNRHSREMPWSTTLSEAWPVMQGQALHMIMGMIQSCQLKNDPLVKHCLDFIAVVGGEDGLPMPNVKILENFRKAGELVYGLCIDTEDTRIEAVSLRTLCTLMRNPSGPWSETEESFSFLSLDALLQAMRRARMCQDASPKDVFHIQVFGCVLISHVISSSVIPKSNQYIQHVHEVVDDIIRYIGEGGEEFFFENSHHSAGAVEVSCCRYACHCCFIHESCAIHDILAAITAVSKLLRRCGKDVLNAENADGKNLLHKLASSGLKECLKVFLEECHEDLNFLQRSTDGATALQLALASSDPSCAVLLEKPTERAQDAQVKESAQSKRSVPKASPSVRLELGAHTSNRREMPKVPGSSQEEGLRKTAVENPDQLRSEKAYERALAERCQQLEDMEAVVSRKSVSEKMRRCDQQRSVGRRSPHQSTVLLSPQEASPRKGATQLFGNTSNDARRQQQLFGTSVSVNSGTNNGSPDPTAAPAGAGDDRIVDNSLSVFHREPPSGMGAFGGAEKIAGAWQSLLATEVTSEGTTGGTEGKWTMLSSSSGQNNQTTADPEKQHSLVQQQIWPPLSVQPRRTVQGQHPTYDSKTSDLPGSYMAPSVGRDIAEDDVADDTQLMSWLSVEITGLIGTDPPPVEKLAVEMQSTRDFSSECLPPAPLQSVPAPPAFDGVDDTAGFLPPDHSVSPFYHGNPMGVAPYIHASPSNFVQSHSSPWGNAGGPTVTMDPRLIPQSEISGADRPAVHPSRFWHTEENDIPSKHLWLGNLNTRLPRSVLKSVFEEFGPIEDVVTFPGRMYAFVNFINPEDAQCAAKELDNMSIPVLTGNRKLVIKFRPNRKALGRVGDLMPGVASIDDCNAGAIAPSISVPVFRSPDLSGSQHSGPELRPSGEGEPERPVFGERETGFETGESGVMMGAPCRHLWLGNVCSRPSKTVLFSLFSRYGPVESVRVFPGKTYAFVNFYSGEHAHRAKEALDGKNLAAITGNKTLVVRFQREGSGPTGWSRGHESGASIPPLQSAESAPGAHVAKSALLSSDRSGIDSRSGYRSPSNETHRPPSLSPEDYPPLNFSGRTAEAPFGDRYPADRRQRLSVSEAEGLWTEGAPREMGGVGYAVNQAPGFGSERQVPGSNHAAWEASSIGHLTRTLSAATFGRGQRPAPYMQRPAPVERNPSWNPALVMETGFDDRGLQSSYSATLNASHSFGGYDMKGYSSPYFNPSFPTGNAAGIAQNPLWPHRAGLHQLHEPSLSSQPIPAGTPDMFTEDMNAHMSFPQEALNSIPVQSATELAPPPGQQTENSGFVSSAVISCDKGSIW